MTEVQVSRQSQWMEEWGGEQVLMRKHTIGNIASLSRIGKNAVMGERLNAGPPDRRSR
jgi:hypothetical protein